jgi:2-C-methyl-D-erythritol 2,4-cyclodiphosphate synthase
MTERTARFGIGYDSHRFAPGSGVRLGGVWIPCDVALTAHSDGDAICHAVTDAILGAAALGDIGEMFPDTDPANSGRDSIDMLALAVERLAAKQFEVGNVDVTVVAEKPRLGPHKSEIAAALARTLRVDMSAVSVKGKSNEGMGWIGRREGLACIAVASVLPKIR